MKKQKTKYSNANVNQQTYPYEKMGLDSGSSFAAQLAYWQKERKLSVSDVDPEEIERELSPYSQLPQPDEPHERGHHSRPRRR